MGGSTINSQFVFHFWRDGIPGRIIESVEWKGSATEALPSREESLLKDSGVSIASSTIPVYRPILNGRSNGKWIQTAANRVPASYESACWKPPLSTSLNSAWNANLRMHRRIVVINGNARNNFENGSNFEFESWFNIFFETNKIAFGNKYCD